MRGSEAEVWDAIHRAFAFALGDREAQGGFDVISA
jgi:hypothetical protein